MKSFKFKEVLNSPSKLFRNLHAGFKAYIIKTICMIKNCIRSLFRVQVSIYYHPKVKMVNFWVAVRKCRFKHILVTFANIAKR